MNRQLRHVAGAWVSLSLLCPSCTERNLEEDAPPLSVEEICNRFCAFDEACSTITGIVPCPDTCLMPQDHWPGFTDECTQALRDMYRCLGSLTCEEYTNRFDDDDNPCQEEEEAWINVPDECFDPPDESTT